MRAVAEVATYSAFLAVCFGGLVLAARRRGFLGPVLAGAAAHAAVVLVVHLVSVSRGDDGFLYRDDRGYSIVGERLADVWSTVGWVDPTVPTLAGSHTVGYPMLVGAVFLWVGPSVLAVKLLNVVLGACTVLLAARIAEEIGLAHRARVVAWAVALWPTLLWWSGPMMKEQLAAALLLGAVLAALRLPGRAATVGLAASLSALILVRMPGFITACLVAVGLVAILVARRDRSAWGVAIRVTSSVAVALAVFLFGFSVGSPTAGLTAYEQIVTTSDPPGDAAGGAAGGATGSEERPLPLRVIRDAAATFVAPLPWAFDEDTDNWDRGLYPGMWLWYALLPTVLVGFVALRRNGRAIVALLVPVLTFATMAPLLSGIQFRQRSSVEVFMLIAAAAVAVGAAGWERAGLRAGWALALAAVIAGVHSGSILVFGLVLLGAGTVLGARACGLARSRRLVPRLGAEHPDPTSLPKV